MGRSGMGKTFRSLKERCKAYSEYVWAKGDPRPPLLGWEEVRALADTSEKWQGLGGRNKVGKLTVLGYAFFVSQGDRIYGWSPYCQCECGWEGCVLADNLLAGKSTRCSECAKKKASSTRWKKFKDICPDDYLRACLLNRLSAIIHRCRNPKDIHYADYGGRGITVAQEWVDDRGAFLRYIKTLDGWDNLDLEIDRINNDGGYEKGNIRFVTRGENLRNTRKVSVLGKEIQRLKEENDALRATIGELKRTIARLEGKDEQG